MSKNMGRNRTNKTNAGAGCAHPMSRVANSVVIGKISRAVKDGKNFVIAILKDRKECEMTIQLLKRSLSVPFCQKEYSIEIENKQLVVFIPVFYARFRGLRYGQHRPDHVIIGDVIDWTKFHDKLPEIIIYVYRLKKYFVEHYSCLDNENSKSTFLYDFICWLQKWSQILQKESNYAGEGWFKACSILPKQKQMVDVWTAPKEKVFKFVQYLGEWGNAHIILDGFYRKIVTIEYWRPVALKKDAAGSVAKNRREHDS